MLPDTGSVFFESDFNSERHTVYRIGDLLLLQLLAALLVAVWCFWSAASLGRGRAGWILIGTCSFLATSFLTSMVANYLLVPRIVAAGVFDEDGPQGLLVAIAALTVGLSTVWILQRRNPRRNSVSESVTTEEVKTKEPSPAEGSLKTLFTAYVTGRFLAKLVSMTAVFMQLERVELGWVFSWWDLAIIPYGLVFAFVFGRGWTIGRQVAAWIGLSLVFDVIIVLVMWGDGAFDSWGVRLAESVWGVIYATGFIGSLVLGQRLRQPRFWPFAGIHMACMAALQVAWLPYLYGFIVTGDSGSVFDGLPLLVVRRALEGLAFAALVYWGFRKSGALVHAVRDHD